MFYSRFLHLMSEKISLAEIWAHFLVKCYETITFRQRKWANYSKCFRCAFHMHSTVSLKGQPSVGPFFYSPRMSHAYHASTPTHTLTYPTTYHYDPILGKADCPVHLELVRVQSQPGMTEEYCQRYSQRTMERPNLASPGKRFRENLALFSVCQHCRATKADAQIKMIMLVSGFCSGQGKVSYFSVRLYFRLSLVVSCWWVGYGCGTHLKMVKTPKE